MENEDTTARRAHAVEEQEKTRRNARDGSDRQGDGVLGVDGGDMYADCGFW